jgi:hypothetical protein
MSNGGAADRDDGQATTPENDVADLKDVIEKQ